MQIMLGYLVEAFRRYAPAARDVLQERPYLLRPFRPAKRQQQYRVKIH